MWQWWGRAIGRGSGYGLIAKGLFRFLESRAAGTDGGRRPDALGDQREEVYGADGPHRELATVANDLRGRIGARLEGNPELGRGLILSLLNVECRRRPSPLATHRKGELSKFQTSAA